MMGSENFSFGFTEDVGKFVVLRRAMERLEANFTRYKEFA